MPIRIINIIILILKHNALYQLSFINLLFMSSQTEVLAHQILKHLLRQVDNGINQIQLIKQMPVFLNDSIGICLSLQFQALACDPQLKTLDGMRQQLVSDVKKLDKDSLIPKGISKQSQEIDSVTIQKLPSPNAKKRGLNGTKSTFRNKNNNQSLDTTYKNSQISSFSMKKKKKQASPFISLVNQEDDVQISKLRKKKDFQISQREKSIKQQQQRHKSFLQKQQNFIKQQQQKDFTYDFEGDFITNQKTDEKINYNSMRMKLSLMDRKLRSNMKFNQSQDSKQIKVKNKNSLTFQDASLSVQFASIPVFKNQNSLDPTAIFGLPAQMGKCKLKDYKKHYGGKFSRLQKSLNTIDATSQKKNDQFNHIFSQRRYLKDQQNSINQSMVSYRTRIQNVTRRKLALPKIHGKYSTLDRYQQY